MKRITYEDLLKTTKQLLDFKVNVSASLHTGKRVTALMEARVKRLQFCVVGPSIPGFCLR